ncbi:MAG: Magnesium-protoporphyrin O-methyltransferase [Pseudomonadota bacterium]|jgi:magnesium-protoporphyrin O-methyltransferase
MWQATYEQRREEIAEYFDRTAAKAWARLTSNEPLGRIRQTVREGRDQMREVLLSWLPHDLHGRRILDAGCGTGALAQEAARRGAHVVAIDLSPTLVDLARERLINTHPELAHRIEFASADMLDPAWGEFDHVVAMDSLIHYQRHDIVQALHGLSARCRYSMVFTIAPRTPLLAAMHRVGRMFPRSDRSPSLEPIDPHRLDMDLKTGLHSPDWQRARMQRVKRGFYISQAMELRR